MDIVTPSTNDTMNRSIPEDRLQLMAIISFFFLLIFFYRVMKPVLSIIINNEQFHLHDSSSGRVLHHHHHRRASELELRGGRQEEEEEERILLFPWKNYFIFTMIPPIVGLWSCLLISIVRDFDQVIKTHCGTANFFPSISSCIGGFEPQRHIWSFAVLLYIQPRIVSAFIMFQYLAPARDQNRLLDLRLNYLRFFVHTTEQLALGTLTIMSSRVNKPIHEISFGVFWICSLLNMLLTNRLAHQRIRYLQKNNSPEALALIKRDEVAFSLRLQSAFIHFASSIGAIFWYGMHNYLCQDFFFSYFSLAEWIVVFSNISFHSAEFLEAHYRKVQVSISSTPSSPKII